MKKIRQEFADTMLEIGQKDSRLTVLVGDISHFILQPFAKSCPGRFYNIGICEPTMMNIAAGLSKVGFIPVVHTIAPFLIERSFEQIKLNFGYQKLGVNIVSIGAGFDYGGLGSTHHCYDDFSLLKNVEDMQITFPASCKEFNLLFKQSYDNGFPTYFRIPENQHTIEFKDEQIKFGKGIIAKEGEDITIVAVGHQLKTALDSAELLKKSNIYPEVIYLHTIKPFDKQTINKSLTKTRRCLVLEEHSMYGGVYDDVLRYSNRLNNVKYLSINLKDKFVRGYGSYKQHCKNLNFSPEAILEKILKELI